MKKVDKNFLDAYLSKSNSEESLKMIPFFERLFSLHQSGTLTLEEFEHAKLFLLTYNSNRMIDDYGSFLDAVLILSKALHCNIINERFYKEAVKETLCMKKNKFLAQLLYAQIIDMKDYKKPDSSRRLLFIEENDFAPFGTSTPPRIAIALSEKYDFKIIKITLNCLKQNIVMKKGDKQFTINKGFSIFRPATTTIKDENNIKYTYKELLKKLEDTYGTV